VASNLLRGGKGQSDGRHRRRRSGRYWRARRDGLSILQADGRLRFGDLGDGVGRRRQFAVDGRRGAIWRVRRQQARCRSLAGRRSRWWRIWAAGAAAFPWVSGVAAIGGGIFAMRQSWGAGYDGLTSGQRLDMQRGGSLADARLRAWNSDRSRLGVPALGGPQLDAPGLSPTMIFGTGVSGDRGPITAQLSGSAVVGGEVTVNNIVQAGSELLSIVARQGKLSSWPAR
jgi:hypothetical protein